MRKKKSNNNGGEPFANPSARGTRTDIVLVLWIFLGQEPEQFNFRLGLHQERPFRFDNLDCHVALGLHIFGTNDLSKTALPDALFEFVSTIKHFPFGDNVVKIFIVPAIVCRRSGVDFGLCFTARFAVLVVYAINLFVRVDERHGQLGDGPFL